MDVIDQCDCIILVSILWISRSVFNVMYVSLSKYLVILCQVAEHHNDSAPSLHDHAPEVFHSVLQGTLSGNEGLPMFVTLYLHCSTRDRTSRHCDTLFPGDTCIEMQQLHTHMLHTCIISCDACYKKLYHI